MQVLRGRAGAAIGLGLVTAVAFFVGSGSSGAALATLGPIAASGAGAPAGPAVRLVVGYRAGTTTAVATDLERRHGLTDVATIADIDARVVTVPAAAAPAVLGALRADAAVAYAEVDAMFTPAVTPVTPDDPYFANGINGQEWGESLDQAPNAWAVTTGSSAVTVAVVDSGAVATQPDLQPVLVPGWNVLTGTADTADAYGHGTEVSGVAVAATNNSRGVSAYCWTCRLMPVEVYDNGSGALASNLAAGITWATDHGAGVINVSLAGTTDSGTVDNAIAYALAHDVTVVAAAGDNGSTAPEYPAATPGVISVAASTQSDALYSYSEHGSWVGVAAPGSQATTLPNGGYGSVGGTSIAAPAVSGIVGLMLSVNPTATPSQIADALFRTASPLTGTAQVAHGRVNAYDAVTAIGSATSAPSSPSPSPAPTGSTGTTSTTFSGSLNKGSATFPLSVGSGTATSALSFPKCASLTLSVQRSDGTVMGKASGPSVLSLASTLSAGPYVWVVSGSCRTSFTLTVTAPSG